MAHNFYKDIEQVEYDSDRLDDVFQRGCGAYRGAIGLARQMRKQDSDTDQDWTQLQDAE